MKDKVPEELERCRVVTGFMGSNASYGWNGVFEIKHRGKWYTLIISDGMGFEHVSVEVDNAKRCPTWEEMNWIKDLCWKEDEWVVQYHPAKTDYVNVHPYVLHLWRPIDVELPKPEKIMV